LDEAVEDEVSEGICLDSKDEPRQNQGREIQQPKWVYLWAKLCGDLLYQILPAEIGKVRWKRTYSIR
jgi:hypothetical protein